MSEAKHTLGVLHGKQIHEMSSDEIRELLVKLKTANMVPLAQVKSQKKAIEHPSQIRENKKMIARCMTILIQRGERCFK
jgi:ribosomal protein L29